MGLGSIIGNIFNGGASAGYRDAYRQFEQNRQNIETKLGNANDYLSPYGERGQNALDNVESRLGDMSDPMAYINQIMGGYSLSPQAQLQMERSLDAANSAAAAGGMGGSSQVQNDVAELVQKLIAGDEQQYLNNVMGVNSQYLAGESGLGQMGYNADAQQAANEMNAANMESGVYNNKADAAFGRARGKYGAIDSGLAMLAGMATGGAMGGSMGKMGGQLAGQIGKMFQSTPSNKEWFSNMMKKDYESPYQPEPFTSDIASTFTRNYNPYGYGG